VIAMPKSLKRSSKGFTLIELLVAISIAGAIMGVMTMTIMTMMRVGPKNNAQAIVFTQVQNAGLFISRDAMMADNITTRPSNSFLSLYWTGTEPTPVIHTIDYVIENTIEGTVLKRQTSPEGAITQIAEYIDLYPATSANLTASDSTTKAKLVFIIQSSFGGAEAHRTYAVTPRRM